MNQEPCIVKKEWLNTAYPGWEVRRLACEALAYTNEDLMAAVFTETPTNNQDIDLRNIDLNL